MAFGVIGGQGTGTSKAAAIVVDASGNAFVTGSFNGVVDFDPGTGVFNMTSSGGENHFVAKYDADGALVWAKTSQQSTGQTSTSYEYGESIALDSSGNVIVGGYFAGSLDFNGAAGTNSIAATGGDNYFVAKYDSSGNLTWVRTADSSTHDDRIYGISVDGSGNVIAVGMFDGTVDFNPQPGSGNFNALTADGGDDNYFVLKLNSSGNYVWARTSQDSTDTEEAREVAVDSAGNSYVVGYFNETVDFAGSGSANTFVSTNGESFVAKYDSGGTFQWVQTTNSPFGSDLAQSVATDGTHVYVAGYFSGTVDWDDSGFTAVNATARGGEDVYFAKYNASTGSLLWAKTARGTDNERAEDIAVDSSGNIYVTGRFKGTVDFDPGAGVANLTSSGSSNDYFVAKYDSNGSLLWANHSDTTGQTNNDEGYAIAVGPSGNVYFAGLFKHTVDFDPGAGTAILSNTGHDQHFVALYDSGGTIGSHDSTPPDTTIVSGPSGVTNSSTAVFDYGSNESGVSYEARLNGSSFVSVSDPQTFTGLADGTYTLQVRAKDAAGNTDASPASRTFTVDTTAPDTSIVTGPSGVTNSSTAVFDYGSNESGVSYEARLNGSSFVSVSDPQTFTGLADGTYTLQVRAKDAAGNTDASPASRTFTVDTTAPDTSIVTGPSGVTNSSTAIFDYGSNESGVSYEARLNGSSFVSVSDPQTFTGLADGTYTLQVRAKDAAGNTDASPASRTFTVDTNTPDGTIVTGPDTLTNNNDAVFDFSSDETPATYDVVVDGTTYSNVSDPLTLTDVADGTHTLTLFAKDAAGNVDPTPVTHTWTVDTNTPDGTIVTGPDTLTNNNDAVFDFSSDETPATYDVVVDGTTYSNVSDPLTLTDVADGTHTLTLFAKDAAGNVDPTPVTHTWTVDTNTPDGTIVTGPDTLTNNNDAVFDFSSDETPATYDVVVDGTTYSNVSDPLTLTDVADGTHTLTLFAKDEAGNVDPTPVTHTWTVDTNTPDGTIVTGPDTLTNDNDAVFDFSSDETPATYDVVVDGTTYSNVSDPLTLTDVADGTHTLTLFAKDEAGNVDPTPVTHTWTVDTNTPDGTIVTGPDTLTNNNDAVFDFSSDETPATYDVVVDGTTYSNVSDPLTLTDVADGTHTLTLFAKDAAGNVDPTPVTHTWTVDTNTPDGTIVTGPDTLTNNNDAVFDFSSDETPATYDVVVDGTTYSNVSDPLTLTDVADGTHTLTLFAKDEAGNLDPTPVTHTWTVDTNTPDGTIVTGPDTLTNDNDAVFDFSSDETPATYDVVVDGTTYSNVSDPLTLTDVADGTHTLTLFAKDEAGNVDPTPVTHTWTVDTNTPDGTIVTGPDTLTNDNDAVFDFTSDETPATYDVVVDGTTYSNVSDPLTLTDVADGTHTLTLFAKDAAGNVDPTPVTHTWTVDTNTPDGTIVTGPDTLTNDNDAVFDFSSDETPATYDVVVDGTTYSNVSDPLTLTDVADGTHTLTLFAKDAAGNVDPTPVTHTWTVDTNTPDGTIVTGPDTLTSNNDAVFDFSSDETPATYDVVVDGTTYSNVSDPLTLTDVADGTHTLTLFAKDEAGNVDPTPVTHTWTVDTNTPDGTIVTGPDTLTNDNDAVFDFSSDETPATYDVVVDGTTYSNVSDPLTLTDVADGTHTLTLFAKDEAGNVDPTPVTHTWTVDTNTPDGTIVTGPDTLTNDNDAVFDFTSDETPATYDVVVDGTTYSNVSDPLTLTDVADGTHTLTLFAKDEAGNVDPTPVTHTWTVDTNTPDGTIVTGPDTLTNDNDAVFDFSSDETPATYDVVVDGTTYSNVSDPLTLTDVADGTHTLTLFAKDEAGNVDTTPVTHTWTVDTNTPDGTIVTGPDTLTNDNDAVFDFSSDETPATYDVVVDGTTYSNVSDPLTLTDVADGTHTLTLFAKDEAGNVDPTPVTHTWTVDTNTPDGTIVTGPDTLTNDNDAVFDFSSDETPATYDVVVDGTTYSNVSDPLTLTDVADGTHTLTLFAKDAAGNVDPTPVFHTWTVDTNTPDGTIVTGPDTLTNDNDAVFDFSSDETPATYDVVVDGTTYSNVSDPLTLTDVADGTHTLTLFAKDAAGNVDPTPVTHTWTVDTNTPDGTIVTGPDTLTNDNDAVFDFSSDETPATYDVVVDGTTYSNVSDPLTLTDVADGTHTLTLFAKDQAGNVDPTPVTHTWTVDTNTPDGTIVTGPDTLTNDNDAVFDFSSDETPATYDVVVDGTTHSNVSDPLTLTDVADGTHTLTLFAKDAAGNVDPTPVFHTWTVDTNTPDGTIVTGPDTLTNDNDAVFDFSSDETPATYDVVVDGTTYSNVSDPLTLTDVADGTHTLTLFAKDEAGNVDPTPVTHTWTVDTNTPDGTIVTGPDTLTNDNDAVFDFSSDETPATYDVVVDGTTYSNVSDPLTLTDVADGTHTLTLFAKDQVGNVDPTPVAHTWTVDTNTPDGTIVTGPAATTNQDTAFFDFASDETPSSYDVVVDGTTYTNVTDPLTLTGLADGTHTLSLYARDAAGNTDPTPAVHTWTVDTDAPDGTIVTGPAATTNQDTAFFDFASDETPSSYDVVVDGTTYTNVTDPLTLTGLADGTHTLSLYARDAAGNTDPTPAVHTWTVDTDAPDGTIVTGPDSLTNEDTAFFDFTADDTAASYDVVVDGTTYTNVTDPLTLTDLADGTHTLSLYAKDSLGNTDPTPDVHTWTVDTDAPDGTIVTGPASVSGDDTAFFDFASDETPSSYDVVIDGTTYSNVTDPLTLTGLADGTHTLSLYARDAAGNTDPTPAVHTWTVDTDAPDGTIVTGPDSLTNEDTAFFDFTADDTAASYDVVVDGTTYTNVTDPLTLTDLADGTHTLSLYAKDQAGNTDPTPAVHTWTVDETPPDTTILSGPPAITADDPVVFDFGSNEANVTYEVSVNGTSFAPSSDPMTLSGLIEDMVYTLAVRAVDAAGNVDPTPATTTFEFDAVLDADVTAPDTTIVSGPSGTVTSTTAVFDFSSNELDVDYEVSLNGDLFGPSSDPRTFTGLADGTYTLQVRAVDAAFNTDPTPAVRIWTVNSTAPTAPVITAFSEDTGDPDRITTDRMLTLVGTAEADTTVYVYRGATLVGTTQSDGDGDWSLADPSTLAFGQHLYRARSEDDIGNDSEYSDWFDVFVYTPSNSGTNGNDILGRDGQAAEQIHGNNGNDTIFGFGGTDTMWGDNGNNSILGLRDHDYLLGGNGNDVGRGGEGNDTVFGEAGNNSVYGENGNDRLDGGDGRDLVVGDNGNDQMFGGAGADTVDGGAGGDRFYGGADTDLLLLGSDSWRDSVIGSIADLSGDTIDGFVGGAATNPGADAIVVTGLTLSNFKKLQGDAIVDGVLSLADVGGGQLRFTNLDADANPTLQTVQGGDGMMYLYIV